MQNLNENEFYKQLTSRNVLGLVTEEEQEKLKKSKVAIFGVGGFGGIIAEVLARSGVGTLAIVDFDVFDVTNQNRQIYAFTSTLGQSKIDVTERFLKDINPHINIMKFDAITKDSLKAMLDGTTVVVHAVDQSMARLVVSRAAQERKIPQVEGWAVPYCNVVVYNETTPTWEEMYNLKTQNRSLDELMSFTLDESKMLTVQIIMGFAKYKGIERFIKPEKIEQMMITGKFTSFAPLVWMESTLMANETIKVILGWKNLAFAPNWKLYDFYSHEAV